ncbi:MAG: hypothetical protein RMJ98_11135 [Myxococcales bacterium]|nr:hypothetical protein [Polyangiaceae bacterium]MDW8249841.1 hypothetical protein [Myxococcales bacterium]
MAKALSSWKVFPHGPFEQIDANLWRVEQKMPKMPLWRVMAVARMTDGRLVIHNGIALDDPSMKAIEALGDPAFLLVPNGYHRLDARIYKDRYPNLRVVAPRGSRAKVEEVVPVDLTYEQFPGDESVRLETLEGTGEQEGVVIVCSGGKTSVILNDVVFNMPHQPGFEGLIIKLIGSSGGPKITRIARLLLVKNSRAFRAHLERLAALPGLNRVLVSHHETITHDPAGALRRVAATL